MKSLAKVSVIVVGTALICGAAALSWHFVRLRGTQRKLAEDATPWRSRAEAGDANAEYELARLYYRGKGVPQDYKEAAGWYRKAADQGNSKRQYGIGFMYYYGKGVPRDYAAALVWYRKAADQGNPKAQYGLAFMYYDGQGVQQDHAQALDWCRKAAEQGYAEAEYALGYSYYEGKELPQDYTEAVRWYRKSAEQGYANAESDLGYMYYKGEGVPQDYTNAVGWYRKAADQGHARAQSALGYAYSQGKGVPRDYAQSARWYRKAARQGDQYAEGALESMNTRLTAASKVMLSVTSLGSILLLINTRESIRKQQHRRAALAGALGLLWVGADVYGHSRFAILLSLSAVNAFSFCKGLLGGASAAMLFSVAWPLRIKNALSICGIMFIVFNAYATTHFHLRNIADCPRAFYSINALLIGISVTMAILLWLNGEETKGSQSGTDETASVTQPFHI